MTTRKRPRTTKELPKIPDFAGRKEMAKFWDTHDITDYLHEVEPAKVRFAKNLSEGITIRLDTATLRKVRQKAHAKGIGPTTLIRMWIYEHLSSSA